MEGWPEMIRMLGPASPWRKWSFSAENCHSHIPVSKNTLSDNREHELDLGASEKETKGQGWRYGDYLEIHCRNYQGAVMFNICWSRQLKIGKILSVVGCLKISVKLTWSWGFVGACHWQLWCWELKLAFSSVSLVTQSCLCDLMDCSTPGFPLHHQLPELAQTHVHQFGDTTQPSHPLSSPSLPAFSLSQHQGLCVCVCVCVCV